MGCRTVAVRYTHVGDSDMQERSDISVIEAMRSRRSVRAFLDKPVDRPILEEILETALRAPSGVNMQSWHLHVLTGKRLRSFSDRLSRAYTESAALPEKAEQWEYDYYPQYLPEPYLSRRREVGFNLYKLAGVERHDMEARLRQMGRNYRFFDAPVGIIITVFPESATGVLVEIGCLLQNIMLAARQFGLHTCPQAAWAAFPNEVREALGLLNGEKIVVGIALGYEDPDAAVNQLVTDRASLEHSSTFYD